MFYQFKSRSIITGTDLQTYKEDNGTNLDKSYTDWNSKPHFRKILGGNFLTNCPNKYKLTNSNLC